MKFPVDFNLKPANILKIAGLALAAIVIITLTFRMVGSSFRSVFPNAGIGDLASQGVSAPSMDAMYYGIGSEEMAYSKAGGAVSLSARNAGSSIMPPIGGGTTGDNAEEFEVKQYSASIETRHLEDTCGKISGLKSREDVIFENANQYEHSCNYSFKVKKDSVAEILAIIEALDPKELNANTYTIKSLVEDYTSEADILKKKLASIEDILDDAIKAYDDISRLATRTQDVESLAKIIDSKIMIIERLTQERVNINTQLEWLERSKAEQLDRLDYIYFNVNVLENKFIDGQDLKDSWKTAVKLFVSEVNETVQDITVNLVALLFVVLQYVIYFFIILVIVKYGWKITKNFWKK